MDFFNEELGLKIPGHVAVILDGNGRWAKQRKMPRTYGHKVGSQVVEDMLILLMILALSILQYMHFQQKTGNVHKKKFQLLWEF